jgi:hypothetical protein
MYMQPLEARAADKASTAGSAAREIEAETCTSAVTILVRPAERHFAKYFENKRLTLRTWIGRAIAIPNREQRNLNLLLSPPGRPHPDPGLFFARERLSSGAARGL